MSGLIQMAMVVLVLQTSLLNLAGIDIILANWLSGLEAVCVIFPLVRQVGKEYIG